MTQQLMDDIWGSTGTATYPGTTKANLGHVVEIPKFEYQNWWQLRADRFMEYSQQSGVEEWHVDVTYRDNGFAMGSDGLLYQSQIASNLGTDPVGASSAIWKPYFQLAALHRDGLRETWNAVRRISTGPGSVRNLANTHDLVVPAAIEKLVTTTWAEGTGPTVGGFAAGVTPTADTWYRKFIVARPDGVTDVVYDSSSIANNFFTSGAASAAGYTDASLYRRTSYAFLDPSLDIPKYFNHPDDPTRYIWDDYIHQAIKNGVSTGSRDTLAITGVPPGLVGMFNFFIDAGSNSGHVRLSTGEQSDVAVNANNGEYVNSADEENVRDTWDVDSSGQLYVRAQAADMNITLNCNGYIDKAALA